MKRFLFLIVAMLVVASGGSVEAASKRVKKKAKRKVETVEQRVLGKHMCSLQWISWDYFGTVNITKQPDGTLRCVGGQKSRECDDYLKIDGTITIESADCLIFNGVIETKVSYLANGQVVVRTGEQRFLRTGQRRYWRMQNMRIPKTIAQITWTSTCEDSKMCKKISEITPLYSLLNQIIKSQRYQLFL